MVLKGFLVAAVIFLIFSLLPYEAASQSDGPKATDKVNIFKEFVVVSNLALINLYLKLAFRWLL